MHQNDIIKRPVVTEKTVYLQNEQNTWTFEVHPKANKVEIRKAVETLFKVKVASIRTAIGHGKYKRRGQSVGQASDAKKAYVKLVVGQKIEGV